MSAEAPTQAALRAAAAPAASVARLGPWELVRLAGEGAMTQVFRVRPAVEGCSRPANYALKLLAEGWSHQPAAIQFMRREVEVSRAVAHPHLVPILDAHVARAPYYVVMPWLEGSTLAQSIRRGRLSLASALWYARQVAEALRALHAEGWMHADVKPANIFISPAGHATLIDLGFARRREEMGSIVERSVVGTVHYVAPEMVVSAIRPDIRSDIYSLGITMFELLAGRCPFEGQDLADLAAKHRQTQPPDLRRLVPQLPENVAELVRQMIAKEPLRRPQTPAELVDRLVELEIEYFDQREPAEASAAG
jgi:serine/threonine protein kinase